jgi:hypothetical protein
MWVELIKKCTNDCEFNAPANFVIIERAEKELGIEFHKDLRAALMESDGIVGEYGLGVLWTVDRIKSDNLEFRINSDFKDLYMPFDSLLFFADVGNGDQFAYPVQNKKINRNDIFCWNHEDDSRNWVAPDLKTYFEWWLTGKLNV